MRTAGQISLALAAAVLACCGSAGEGDGPVPQAAWSSNFWRRYELAQPHPQAERMSRVFDALRAVAEEKEQRRPHLTVVDTGDANPWAMSLPDGGIVMSRQAIDLCYDGSAQSGDACLAFVLAHEMAHLASEHFQHVGAYFAVQRMPAGEERKRLAETLALSEETLRSRELLADQRALVYMTVAGLDPAPILRDADFFQRWSSQAVGVAFGDDRYPTPRERAGFLRDSLQPVLQQLPLFDWGTRLYQVHRFDEAVAFLSQFKNLFAGPAVLNNLGLSHLQRGLRTAVGQCAEEVFRLRTPALVVDPDTLARRLLYRGEGESCLQGNPDLTEAVRLLEAAARFPSAGPAAKRNHCAALVMARRGREAYLCAGDLLEMDHSPEAHLLEIQANYLISLGSELVDREAVLRAVEDLAAKEKGSALVAFNHASLVHSLRGPADSRPLWLRFLDQEPAGPYAHHARLQLGESVPGGAQARGSAALDPPRPPIPPGPAGPAARAWLSQLEEGPEFSLADSSWRAYSDDVWQVLYRLPEGDGPGRVVLLQRETASGWTQRELVQRHGPFLSSVPTASGAFVRYSGFGFLLGEGRTRGLVFFEDR